MNEAVFGDILKELAQIKKLLVTQLILQGVDGGTIANTLGVTNGRISQIFPVGKLKKQIKKMKKD